MREGRAVAPGREDAVAKIPLHIIGPGAAYTGPHLGFGTLLWTQGRWRASPPRANTVGKILCWSRREIDARAEESISQHFIRGTLVQIGFQNQRKKAEPLISSDWVLARTNHQLRRLCLESSMQAETCVRGHNVADGAIPQTHAAERLRM